MKTVKVLLDTDIGTDIDDAVCLAYLLSQPRCDLLGVTTVTGEAVERAKLVSALCLLAGRDVPIYPGATTPLFTSQRQLHAAQAAGLGRWPHRARFPRGEAVEFLRQTIRRHPGEVVLLTIAPLTNVGLLFSIDPEIPSLLKGLVMMCGRFFDPPPLGYSPIEWNAVVDAHATSIVYSSNVAGHRSLGLDVTSQVRMSSDEFRTIFSEIPLFAPVLDWAEIWFREKPGTIFHDPLAAATIFEPDLCSYVRGKVTVDLLDGSSFGLTRFKEVADGPHRVARTVKPGDFFGHFMDVVGGAGKV